MQQTHWEEPPVVEANPEPAEAGRPRAIAAAWQQPGQRSVARAPGSEQRTVVCWPSMFTLKLTLRLHTENQLFDAKREVVYLTDIAVRASGDLTRISIVELDLPIGNGNQNCSSNDQLHHFAKRNDREMRCDSFHRSFYRHKMMSQTISIEHLTDSHRWWNALKKNLFNSIYFLERKRIKIPEKWSESDFRTFKLSLVARRQMITIKIDKWMIWHNFDRGILPFRGELFEIYFCVWFWLQLQSSFPFCSFLLHPHLSKASRLVQSKHSRNVPETGIPHFFHCQKYGQEDDIHTAESVDIVKEKWMNDFRVYITAHQRYFYHITLHH